MTTPPSGPIASACRALLLLAATGAAFGASAQELAAAPEAAPQRDTRQITVTRLRHELHRGERYLAEGRYGEALEPLQLVTQVQPRHAGAWLRLSQALSGVGRSADARDAAVRAVELLEEEKPERRAGWDPGPFYLQLGKALAATGDLAESETALRRADREQPGQAETLRELGSILLRLGGRDADAAATLRRALDHDPRSARAQVELGTVLLRLGDATGAEEAHRAAAALAPSEPEPWFGLASAAEARGDTAAHAAALATFERLTRERDERLAESKRLDDLVDAAGELMSAGRHAEAVAAYEALLEDPVVAASSRKPLVLLDLGRAALRAGDAGRASSALRAAVDAAPGAPAAQLELGNLLASQGLVDEAFPHLLRAAELDPLHAAAHASLSMAWAAVGRLDEAMAESAKASLLLPEDLVLRQHHVNLLAAAGRMDEARALAESGGVQPPGVTATPATPPAASAGDGP